MFSAMGLFVNMLSSGFVQKVGYALLSDLNLALFALMYAQQSKKP
jgi:hypothetical protein